MASSAAPLLEVSDLRVHFSLDEGLVRAVDGLSYSIDSGRTLGIVGESGCGKTVTAQAILRIVPHPGAIVGGRIVYHPRQEGAVDLTRLDPRGPRMRAIRVEPRLQLVDAFQRLELRRINVTRGRCLKTRDRRLEPRHDERQRRKRENEPPLDSRSHVGQLYSPRFSATDTEARHRGEEGPAIRPLVEVVQPVPRFLDRHDARGLRTRHDTRKIILTV